MRSQECRKHIEKTGKVCHLKEETIKQVQKVLDFCYEHPTLSNLSTDAAEALMKIPDPIIQQKAISVVGKTLNRKTPTGGIIKKRLTKPEVEKVIKKVSPPENVKKESDVKSGVSTKPEDPLPVSPYVPQPGSIEVSGKVQPSLAEQMKEPEVPATPPAPRKLPGDWINQPSKDTEAIKQAAREELEAAAERLLDLMPRSTQLIVTDQLREHTSWKVKDVFYYGIEALAEKKVKK